MFTIPNNVGMYSYKKGIENLLRGKNERHLLPSSENFVLPPVSSLNIVQNLFKPIMMKLAQFLRSVYTQLHQQCNFAFLEHNLPAANQFLDQILLNPAYNHHFHKTKDSTDYKRGRP
jgi:hypothetical protein